VNAHIAPIAAFQTEASQWRSDSDRSGSFALPGRDKLASCRFPDSSRV